MSTLDQYALVGDNDADGDSVYLMCRRCPDPSRAEEWAKDLPSVGNTIKRFQTNHWDEPPTVCTLQDLFRAAREHDAECHSGFTPGETS